MLNHVLLHQTVIGQEAIAQMEMAGERAGRRDRLRRRRLELRRPGVPVPARVLRGNAKMRFLAAEPSACPTLTRGVYRYDFGDTAGLTPLMPMYTLGHDFVPPPVHAGGLRYHGDAPMLCGLVRAGVVEARAYGRTRRSPRPSRSPAPRGSSRRPSRRTRSARCSRRPRPRKQAGEERVILFGLCGHGHFDLAAYDAYLAGELEDPEFSEEDMAAALARLPEAPAIA